MRRAYDTKADSLVPEREESLDLLQLPAKQPTTTKRTIVTHHHQLKAEEEEQKVHEEDSPMQDCPPHRGAIVLPASATNSSRSIPMTARDTDRVQGTTNSSKQEFIIAGDSLERRPRQHNGPHHAPSPPPPEHRPSDVLTLGSETFRYDERQGEPAPQPIKKQRCEVVSLDRYHAASLLYGGKGSSATGGPSSSSSTLLDGGESPLPVKPRSESQAQTFNAPGQEGDAALSVADSAPSHRLSMVLTQRRAMFPRPASETNRLRAEVHGCSPVLFGNSIRRSQPEDRKQEQQQQQEQEARRNVFSSPVGEAVMKDDVPLRRALRLSPSSVFRELSVCFSASATVSKSRAAVVLQHTPEEERPRRRHDDEEENATTADATSCPVERALMMPASEPSGGPSRDSSAVSSVVFSPLRSQPAQSQNNRHGPSVRAMSEGSVDRGASPANEEEETSQEDEGRVSFKLLSASHSIRFPMPRRIAGGARKRALSPTHVREQHVVEEYPSSSFFQMNLLSSASSSSMHHHQRQRKRARFAQEDDEEDEGNRAQQMSQWSPKSTDHTATVPANERDTDTLRTVGDRDAMVEGGSGTNAEGSNQHDSGDVAPSHRDSAAEGDPLLTVDPSALMSSDTEWKTELLRVKFLLRRALTAFSAELTSEERASGEGGVTLREVLSMLRRHVGDPLVLGTAWNHNNNKDHVTAGGSPPMAAAVSDSPDAATRPAASATADDAGDPFHKQALHSDQCLTHLFLVLSALSSPSSSTLSSSGLRRSSMPFLVSPLHHASSSASKSLAHQLQHDMHGEEEAWTVMRGSMQALRQAVHEMSTSQLPLTPQAESFVKYQNSRCDVPWLLSSLERMVGHS